MKEKLNELKILLPVIFLSLKDKETPMIAKLFGIMTIVYALSPIDLIPDFIPVIGYLDDIILIPILIKITIKLIPEEKLAYYKLESKGMWENENPKKWYYAIPIILLWVLLIYILIWFVLRLTQETIQNYSLYILIYSANPFKSS